MGKSQTATKELSDNEERLVSSVAGSPPTVMFFTKQEKFHPAAPVPNLSAVSVHAARKWDAPIQMF